MKRIKFIETCAGVEFTYVANQVYEVETEFAEKLIVIGVAVDTATPAESKAKADDSAISITRITHNKSKRK